jgi:hypothetical protein
VLRLWWDWLGCCDRVSKIFLENLSVVTDFDPYFFAIFNRVSGKPAGLAEL